MASIMSPALAVERRAEHARMLPIVIDRWVESSIAGVLHRNPGFQADTVFREKVRGQIEAMLGLEMKGGE